MTLDAALLAAIANAAFLEWKPSQIGGYQVPYTVQWKLLGRLACACRSLRLHLDGLSELPELFKELLRGQSPASSLWARWNLSPKLLRTDAVGVLLFGKEVRYSISPDGGFGTVFKLNLPSLPKSPSPPNGKMRGGKQRAVSLPKQPTHSSAMKLRPKKVRR